MASRTKRLPIRAIPKQVHVTLVRDNMIHDSGPRTASAAKRMCAKEGLRFALPLLRIATLPSIRPIFISDRGAGRTAHPSERRMSRRAMSRNRPWHYAIYDVAHLSLRIASGKTTAAPTRLRA